MATPTYRNVLRVGEVLQNDLDTNPGGGDPGVVLSAIQDVTGWIAVQIGVDSGTPIIHRTKQGVTRREWLRDDVQEETTFRVYEIGRIEYGTAVQQTTQTIGNQGEATVTKDTDALRRYARDYLNEYTVPQL